MKMIHANGNMWERLTVFVKTITPHPLCLNAYQIILNISINVIHICSGTCDHVSKHFTGIISLDPCELKRANMFFYQMFIVHTFKCPLQPKLHITLLIFVQVSYFTLLQKLMCRHAKLEAKLSAGNQFVIFSF